MSPRISSGLGEKLATLSMSPGVYLFRDRSGSVLYVGKAKRLRPRVRSYFRRPDDHGVKTAELVRRIADVETLVVRSEVEAYLLESNLIKQHRPPFNVRLRDDKAYPYVKITRGPRPEVRIVRRVFPDGAKYFGPYTEVRDLRGALNTVRRMYTVDTEFFEHRQSDEKHEAMARDLSDLLSGRGKIIRERLTTAMDRAARAMAFERAAHYRDALAALETFEGQRQTVQMRIGDYDAIAVARDAHYAAGVRIEVRGGRVVHTEAHMLTNAADLSEHALLLGAVRGFYFDRPTVLTHGAPRRILLPRPVKGRDELEAALAERLGRNVRLHVPKRGTKRQVVDLAVQNARHRLEEELMVRRESASRADDALYTLQESLGLSRLPRRIVCFDIAHLHGTDVVASAVTFENAESDKSGYRKFKIRGDWGNDDFRSMNEVVGRYFGGLEKRGDAVPDLAVIDGGRGQLGAARKALDDLGMTHVDLCSLAKQEEEIFRPDRSESIRLPRRSEGLKLLQRARDEAHRFANTFTGKLRGKRLTSTELTRVPGVGPARAQKLLRHFGSVAKVREASVDDIARAGGLPVTLAQELLKALTR